MRKKNVKASIVLISLSVFLLFAGKILPISATVVETSSESDVQSISLRADEGVKSKIHWTIDGYSEQGFKVVWSKNQTPTYPTREGDKYHYYSEASKRNDVLEPFAGEGEYYVRVCEYLGGKCGIYSNEIKITLNEKNIEKQIACTMEYAPVCGKDGKTYSNRCMLEATGAVKAYAGECKKENIEEKYFRYASWTCYDGTLEEKKDDTSCKSEETWKKYAKEFCEGKCEGEKCGVNNFSVDNACNQIKAIEFKAKKLNDGQSDDILKELNELRSQVREHQSEIKYLKNMIKEMARISEGMQDAIKKFITYGVDKNTQGLGEGERAGVINSFKSAFGKLPEDEADLVDAIKIANGRWPSQVNTEAEEEAKKNFEKIYGRQPDMSNANDGAAVKIMAYGLRQAAKNRNMKTEGNALVIFKNIFGHLPQSTVEWDILRAIAYSGAKR